MRPETASAAEQWALSVPRRALTGSIGERLGRGVGSSVEFEDFRDYQPGDDLRHVDWRGFARTDRLQVRLHRAEVAPVLDIVVDTSASMSSTPAKAAAAQDLVDAACSWSRRDGGRPRVLESGAGRLDPESRLTFDAPRRMLVPRAALEPRGLRFVVSDFLDPSDPLPDLRRVIESGAHAFVVQLLDTWELDPEGSGACTLIDVEDGTRADVILDRPTIEAYKQRLTRLCSAVEDCARQMGASYALIAAREPDVMFRDLLRQGVVEPS